jgi:hypothetical protein
VGLSLRVEAAAFDGALAEEIEADVPDAATLRAAEARRIAGDFLGWEFVWVEDWAAVLRAADPLADFAGSLESCESGDFTEALAASGVSR